MHVYSVGSLMDYDYLRFILKDDPLCMPKKQVKTDTFVKKIQTKALKAVNNESRKSILRSITARR